MLHYIKLRYKLFIALLVFWFLLQLNFRIETILTGLLISAVITELSHNILYDDHGYRYHSVQLRIVFLYITTLFVEIFRSGFKYAWNLMFRHYEPVVFTVRLDVDDPVLVGIIANSITLTPGTISIEVDTDHHIITVLTMAKPGTSLKELEQPIHDKFERLLKHKEGRS